MFSKIKKLFRRSWLSIVLTIFVVIILFSAFLVIYFGRNETKTSSAPYIATFILLIIAMFSIIGFIFIIWKQANEREWIVNKGINYYFENLVSTFSIGIIVFHPNGSVLWVSDFVEERFGHKIIGENITFFNKDLDLNKKISDFQKIFQKNEFIYKISFISKEMILVIQDITQEYSATHFYEIEKLAIGEVEIDNYQLFSSSFSDEEIFNIQTEIKLLFDSLSKKYNFVYKQYMDSKFLVFTNRENLNRMIFNDFKDFEKINKLEIADTRISLSIGFGADTSNYNQLMDMAKEALYQSQTRGGDQITIISSIEKTKRFGSKSEISVVKSRTKIKTVASNFKNKLQDQKIKNVIIYGHKYADLDAIGASYALYEVVKSYGKEAVIQNQTFDNTGQKAIKRYINNPETIFVNKVKVKQYKKEETMIVVVDCSENTRVENPSIFHNALGENVFIFDHHRVSHLDKIVQNLNSYIETSASSASEIITELIRFNEFQDRLSKVGVQMLLNGIYLDTNQFRKSVSSRTFAAASMLEEWGARVDEAISLMKITPETNEKIMSIVSKSKEIKPGFWLSYTDEIIPTDVVSMGADEILKIEGRKAAFVIAQLPKLNSTDKNTYKLSARSVGVNVQLIAEAVGGGGHFNSAAAVSDANNNESLQIFVDNIIQAIISSKEN